MNYQQASDLLIVLELALNLKPLEHATSFKPIGKRPEPAAVMQEKLNVIIVKRSFKRLRDKIENSRTKDYSLLLSDEEALAWYLFWHGHALDHKYKYVQNFLDAQLAEIDHKHG